MSFSPKRVVCTAVMALVALGLCRAALFRYQEKEQAIRNTCREQMQKLGLTRSAAKAKYPTPEIGLISSGCLTPGSTGTVVVKGKFVPDTKFVFENDNVEVVKENLSAGEYRATVRVAPGIGPQSAALTAISPVSGISTRKERAAVVGGKYEWTLDSANGWHIVARSSGNKACGGPDDAGDSYEVQFYRKGESTPFEKRGAQLYHTVYENTHRFSISQEDPQAKAGAQSMADLMKKMADPNLSDAQREQLIRQLQASQAQMQANISKMMDPAYQKQLQEQRQKFGCERIELKPAAGGLQGEMRCAQAVGTRIAVTGTMKFLGQ